MLSTFLIKKSIDEWKFCTGNCSIVLSTQAKGRKMIRVVVCLFLILLMIENSQQFGRGSPVSRCENMLPSHQGAVPQTTPSPYKIVLKETSIGNGQRMSVELKALENGRKFRGFLLQARTIDGRIIGQFQPNDEIDFNFLECNGFRTAVTNSNNNEDSSLTFEWAAPMEFTGKIRFQ